MSGVVRKLFFAGAALLLAALCTVAVAYWQLMVWADQPIAAEPVDFILAPGESLSTLSRDLEGKGLRARYRLILLARLTGAETALQAGEYRLRPGMTPQQLLLMMRNGDVVIRDFRIEEGVTMAAVLRQLHANPFLTVDIQATDVQFLQDELGLQTPFAEGMFFPDTYHFRRGDSARDLLLRAHEAMLTRMQAAWALRAPDSHLKSPYEVVILASIIEKETGRESDRTLISQVFHNRLAKRMLLQTDPTVIYALGADFDGNLTRAHLRIDSPFNTYQYRGLPPTPIALPSVASLQAAVLPESGDYLYFVAKGDGASQFSRTLAQHNAAVREYQLKQRVDE